MGIMQARRKLYSGTVAKERLKLLITSEKADCSPEVLNIIQTEILQVVSKYMDIDSKHSTIKIVHNNKKIGSYGIPRLYASIPLKQFKE